MRSSSNPAGVQIAGGEVRKRRQLLGHNLTRFAPQCGITFQYLSQIETGVRRYVSPEVFAQICDALGVEQKDRESLVVADAA